MEPITHILTGACLARTGLNRRAAYTTVAMAVAAEFPDVDTLWSLRGPVAGFQHHRGITHTFLGIPFEAALIVAVIYSAHRWRAARALPHPVRATAEPRRGVEAPSTSAPVRWGLLYGFTLLALLSHLWLDYTNNYGLRPFFPFNSRWYAGSITFIFDPAMFVLLLAALVLPPLFRLVGTEVGARRQPFAPRGWSVAALLGVSALWGWRFFEHSRAEQMVLQQSYLLPATRPAEASGTSRAPEDPLPAIPLPRILQAERAEVSPDPIDPFRWYSVTDFGPLYQLGTVDLRVGAILPEQPVRQKLPLTPDLVAAEGSPLGRAYLDWSSMPFLEVTRKEQGMLRAPDDSQAAEVAVRFRDPRFLGNMIWLHSGSRTPLTGTVELDGNGTVLRQQMDGKSQR